MLTYETAIAAIARYQGASFVTKTGLEFTYKLEGGKLNISRTTHKINAERNISLAMELMEQGAKASEISSKVHGSSYIKAILSDARIKSSSNRWYEVALTDTLELAPEYKTGAVVYARTIDEDTVGIRSMSGLTTITLAKSLAQRHFKLGRPVQIAA